MLWLWTLFHVIATRDSIDLTLIGRVRSIQNSSVVAMNSVCWGWRPSVTSLCSRGRAASRSLPKDAYQISERGVYQPCPHRDGHLHVHTQDGSRWYLQAGDVMGSGWEVVVVVTVLAFLPLLVSVLLLMMMLLIQSAGHGSTAGLCRIGSYYSRHARVTLTRIPLYAGRFMSGIGCRCQRGVM